MATEREMSTLYLYLYWDQGLLKSDVYPKSFPLPPVNSCSRFLTANFIAFRVWVRVQYFYLFIQDYVHHGTPEI